jgi:hypothetical protein
VRWILTGRADAVNEATDAAQGTKIEGLKRTVKTPTGRSGVVKSIIAVLWV